MLTGPDLLSKVSVLQAQEPPAKMSDIVRACGYERDGKLKYTEFYTALLTEKGLLDKVEESEISEEYREKYDELCKLYGQDPVDEFIELYSEEDLEQFEDAYVGYYDSEAEFAEEFTTDVYGFDIPSFVVIDWEATWNCNLRYDFDFVNGCVFRSNF
jgi:hypothetical protein